MTIKKAIDDYILHCKIEKNLSLKTIEFYLIDLKQFYQFTTDQKIKYIHEVDRNILRSFFISKQEFKPRTIKRKMACLKAMFTYMEFSDLIDVNPFRKMQLKYNTPKYLPTVMNQTEVQSILEQAYTDRRDVQNQNSFAYQVKTRDICILEMLFATGIRVSELCNLKKSQIDLSTGIIQVSGKGNKERIVQIVDSETKSLLKEYYQLFAAHINETGFFFVNRLYKKISDQSVRFMIRKYTQMAGIRKNITPHTFRHTFATLLLEADVDIKYIQQFLGHSSIVTTQIYTHVNKEKQLQILNSKHPRLNFKMERG